MPIRSNEIINKELKVEYLGWYVNWDPQKAFYYASEHCGFIPDDQRSE